MRGDTWHQALNWAWVFARFAGAQGHDWVKYCIVSSLRKGWGRTSVRIPMIGCCGDFGRGGLARGGKVIGSSE